MVRQTARNAKNNAGQTKGSAGAKRAMGKLKLPGGKAALIAKNAALESKLKRLTEALRAAKAAADAANAVAAKLQEQSEALRLAGAQERGAAKAAPVPAVIEPLPKELEQVLGREAIWSLVRPAEGTDSRSVVERHGVFWKQFDEALKDLGAEGSKEPKVLRKPLQDYLDSLVGLQFTKEEKKRIVARLNRMMRILLLRTSYRTGIGPLVVSKASLRIQASVRFGDGKCKRVYTSLGTNFPSLSLAVAEAPQPKVAGADRKLGRYKYL